MSNDQTLADFVSALLTSIGPNTFQAFSDLHRALPVEGSVYIKGLKDVDITDGGATVTIQRSVLNGRWDFINKDCAPIPPIYGNLRMPCNKVCVFPVGPPLATSPSRPLLSIDASPALRCYGLIQHCVTAGGPVLSLDQVIAVIALVASFVRAAPDLTNLDVKCRARRYSAAASWYQSVRPGLTDGF